MRHRVRGRILGRNSSHRKAMFRNMAVSLIQSVRADEDQPNVPKVPGRITTTVAKAKELRPFVERLVTMARHSLPLQREANRLKIQADRNSSEWKNWRESDGWVEWNQAQSQALAIRRRAFAMLRDDRAIEILFNELAERFEDRPGGYTRVLKLANRRLGDGGFQAIIEFVGVNDRVKTTRSAPMVSDESETAEEAPVAEEVAEETPATEVAATEETAGEEEKKADA